MAEKERYYKMSLLKSLAYDDDVNGNCDGMIDFTVIDSIGGADVVEVKHGYWNYDGSCGVCKKQILSNYMNYCPHCGAKMDGERKE